MNILLYIALFLIGVIVGNFGKEQYIEFQEI